ncbi:FYVE, RhoGEF and PH domain-containing protein 3 isoform X2 [Vicugna pacos]|uniref:FYVE, RhoGEF and PH domain-containing protein 3 isoform X2 n=1 Tax=Vicugna pacos TaxID=30538 RepID=A0ABM5D2U4_VICPA
MPHACKEPSELLHFKTAGKKKICSKSPQPRSCKAWTGQPQRPRTQPAGSLGNPPFHLSAPSESDSLRKLPASPSRSSERSTWRMESEGGSSTSPATLVTLKDPDTGLSSSSLDLPSADPGKLQALPVGPEAHCGDPASGSPGSQASAGHNTQDTGSVGDPSSISKIPNRDSGIDSPSCSVVGEHFPCEESGEAGPGPTTKALHPDTTPDGKADGKTDGKAPREEVDSDVGEGSSEEPDPENNALRADVDPAKHSEPQKLLHIAQELLHTEETYVKRLHLLDQVFCTQLTEAGIPSEVITGIFSNISSIYRFHGQFLLPELQTRITNEWDTNPRLGDILQKLAPFLKMYGEYVKNFDRAMELVSTWTQRSPLFKDIVQGIQKQEMCGNLTLQHHMLEPVQRVPRYELLLKDYLKRLPEDAPDWKDAERSLELISTAANHSNAAIRKMEKMHKLLEVYERLGGEEDIVNPANELIKEGQILKLSAKNGTAQDRHLFLFNSMILYCVPKLRLMGQKFSVREKMDISGLQVQDIVKPNAAHTFLITGKKRSLELQTRTEEEKKEWIQVIEATIEKHKQNSQTFKTFSGSFGQDEDSSLTPDSSMVSTNSEAPTVVPNSGGGTAGLEPRRGSSKTRRDKEKQGCRSCGETFNSITKRKHHCKLCGAVICGKCSEFKAEHGRQSRVCRECFQAQPVASSRPEEHGEPKQSTEPVAEDTLPSLLCGPLQVSDGSTAWSKVWAAISESEPLELVLHLQGGSQDGQLLRAIPLSGCRVSVPDPAERPGAGHVWQLQQARESLYLSASSAELQQQWLEALSTAARGPSAQAPEGP